jgi:hypothetical protein
MADNATTYTIWTSTVGIFNNNKKTHEIYIAEEFCNVK